MTICSLTTVRRVSVFRGTLNIAGSSRTGINPRRRYRIATSTSAKVQKCRLTLPVRASQGKQENRTQTFERMVCETARWPPQKIPPLRRGRVGQPIRSHATLAMYREGCMGSEGLQRQAFQTSPCQHLLDGMGFSALWVEATLASPHHQREGAQHHHDLASAPPCCAGRQSTTHNPNITKIKHTTQLTHTDVHKLGDRRTVGLKADGNNT